MLQASIKERWQQLNAAIDLLIDQQKGWRVPDQALRANLHDAIAEDFVIVYKVKRLCIFLSSFCQTVII